MSRAARPRFPEKPPSLGTVRRWMKQLEAAGDIEPKGVDRNGKPGRPAMLYGLTEAGKERAAATPDFRTQLTELQAKRARARTRKGMSEDQAIAAVTTGWARP